MSWQPIDAPTVSRGDSDDDDELNHGACECSEDISLCGKDVSGLDWLGEDISENPDVCVVCIDLAGIPCPRCGR